MSCATPHGLRSHERSACHVRPGPGCRGSAWYWHRLVPRLTAAGHAAVAVELPAADDDAGLHAYADVIAGAIDGVGPVVLVAQSMGALSAPLVCDRGQVERLVLVAPMIPAPHERCGDWWHLSGQVEAQRALDLAEGRDPDVDDLRDRLMHDVPAEVVAEALARGAPVQSARPFQDCWPLDAWPEVRTEVIAARNDRLFPLSFLHRLSAERLGVTPAVLDAGHLPALSRADALADLLITMR